MIYYLDLNGPTNYADHVLEEAWNVFEHMEDHEREEAYQLRLDLAQGEGEPVYGETWGHDRFFDQPQKVAQVMRRLGHIGHENLRPVELMDDPHPFHYAVNRQINHIPHHPNISFVNGMQTAPDGFLGAGASAQRLSDRLADSRTFSCIYNPTHGNFEQDFNRYNLMKAGGVCTRTACLIAQQWIDFLRTNPESRFLQIAFSEGATHTWAALNLLRDAGLHDLISRINIVTLCPATIITPDTLTNENLQVVNFVKWDDQVPMWLEWGGGIDHIVHDRPERHYMHIVHPQVLPNGTYPDPHDLHATEYMEAAEPFVRHFIDHGFIRV